MPNPNSSARIVTAIECGLESLSKSWKIGEPLSALHRELTLRHFNEALRLARIRAEHTEKARERKATRYLPMEGTVPLPFDE